MVSARFAQVRVLIPALLLCALILPLQPASAAAQPAASPTPTVGSVTSRLNTLSRRAERLAEQYNKARIDVGISQRAAVRAQSDAAAAARTFRVGHAAFVTLINDQYQSGSVSTTSMLLTSRSGQDYLDRLQLRGLAADHQSAVVGDLLRAQTAADTAKKKAAGLFTAAESRRKAVAAKQSRVAAQTKQYNTLLATLTTRQRHAYTTQGSAAPVKSATAFTVHGGSAAAHRAVNFALAQVGKPYVFGAAGPGSYDCSGLTMAAWRAGGVSLPHLAASQFNYGTHVTANQLQPGDLVFLYSPIGHVSMYIGGGQLVSAPQPGENVKVVPFAYFKSDFVGATRLG